MGQISGWYAVGGCQYMRVMLDNSAEKCMGGGRRRTCPPLRKPRKGRGLAVYTPPVQICKMSLVPKP